MRQGRTLPDVVLILHTPSTTCLRSTLYRVYRVFTLIAPFVDRAGLNVLLISRTQSKLDEAAADIRSKYKVQAKTVALDFGAADAAAWERVKAEVRLV